MIIILNFLLYIYNKMKKKEIIAISCFQDKKIKGTIQFKENNKKNIVDIEIHLSGFQKNAIHAMHIHEAGDLTDKCMGACAHFNPFHKNHGGIASKERHVGDLGNIIADKNGNIEMSFSDHMIKLRGTKSNIIGRSVVIHADIDDNGLGGHEDSLTTGHAGARIACAVIGYSKEMFLS